MAATFRPRTQHHAKQADGKRSGLETQIATQLDAADVEYQYEKGKIPYVTPAQEHTYLPDFRIPNKIIIEAKGKFDTADRKKHLLVKAQNPELDIRFVFSNPNQRISKQSATTYAMWCEKHGFKYAKQFIPKEWF